MIENEITRLEERIDKLERRMWVVVVVAVIVAVIAVELYELAS